MSVDTGMKKSTARNDTIIGITANYSKPEAIKLCARIIEWLNDNNISCTIDEETAEQLSESVRTGVQVSFQKLRDADITLTLGGDGFLIHTVRRLFPCSCAFLPVNLGSLGFNAQVKPEETFTALERALNDELHTQSRVVLKAEVLQGDKRVYESYALNEILIAKTAQSRIINVAMRIQGEEAVVYHGDGVIVCTPTGSTAYNLSAGGPVVHPEVEAMVVVPLSPHSLTHRALVIPALHTVELKYQPHKDREEPLVYVDGQDFRTLTGDDTVVISRAPGALRVLTLSMGSYLKALREKLLWGGR